MKIAKDTADFLEAFLFAIPEYEPEEIREASIYDFSPEFIEAVSGFIFAFRDFANDRNPEALEAADNSTRSFGGNVYFSLSSQGCGFWDSDDTEPMQAILEEFSRNKYRFEEMPLAFRDDGKIDFAILPEYLAEYRQKKFSVR